MFRQNGPQIQHPLRAEFARGLVQAVLLNVTIIDIAISIIVTLAACPRIGE
jgi:hypothetical protein